MATVEYFFIKIKDLDNTYINKDFTLLLKEKVDKLNPNDMHCEGKSCDVLLAEYKENYEPQYNITFDFSKLTSETVTSALKYNILENIDTFKDLDEKTLALVSYNKKEENTIRKVLKSSNDIDKLINNLESLDIDFFKIYKIIKENNINRIVKDKDLLFTFHKKHLKRYKKDKTFFNTFRLKDMNVIQLQKNINGVDYRKVEKYFNDHLLINDELQVTFERIYDSEFMEMLKHHELKHFEITYHSESKTKLLNKNANTLLFQLSDLLGKNNTKITAIADKDSSLDNQKILEFFEMANSLGILDECKLKPNVKGQRGLIGSTDKGSILTYNSQYPMNTLDVANLVFLDAYKAKIDTLTDRIL